VRLRAVWAHSVEMGPDMHCCRSSWPIRNVHAFLLHSRSLAMRTKSGDQQYHRPQRTVDGSRVNSQGGADVKVPSAAKMSKRNRGPRIGWHAEPRKARPQNVREVTKSAQGHTHSSLKIRPVPFLYIRKKDTGGGVVPGRGKKPR